MSIRNMHELHHSLGFAWGAAPVVISDTTPVVSAIVDMQGQQSVEFVILTGTLADADATFTVLVEHGEASNLSDAAAAPDEVLLGTEAEASFTFAADNTVKTIGYSPEKGAGKRYVRCTVTPAANTGAAPLAIAIVKLPKQVPVA